MPFSKEEHELLISLKGVGPTVVKRFEEIGINSLKELKQYNAEDIAEMVASMLIQLVGKTVHRPNQQLMLL